MDNISDIVWLIKAGQKQDKDLQKGKKAWICEQACSEKLLL